MSVKVLRNVNQKRSFCCLTSLNKIKDFVWATKTTFLSSPGLLKICQSAKVCQDFITPKHKSPSNFLTSVNKLKQGFI
ncbi:MAG: hypothetical protein EOO34_00705 [Cyanobacteriota bacterium]|nr:MAG: hypothetical protein EOO34_00705 [Cyanobacteriota bacterium]